MSILRDQEREQIINAVVGVIVVVLSALAVYTLWGHETNDDKMEGYGFNKVCQQTGTGKNAYPICIQEVWVLGHEFVAPVDVPTYIRKREATE